MGFKALALDLDGTLLTSAESVSERNLLALAAARAAGMVIILASARWYQLASRVAGLVGAAAPGDGDLDPPPQATRAIAAAASASPRRARLGDVAVLNMLLDITTTSDWSCPTPPGGSIGPLISSD